MAQLSQAGTHVEVGVEIDDADGFAGRDIAEKMSIRRLVSAAEHDRNSAGAENGSDHLSQLRLTLFQWPGDAEIAGVERTQNPQVHFILSVARRQAIEPAANFGRGLGGAGASLIAAHTFVLGKADNHRPSRLKRRRIAAPEFHDGVEAGIVGTLERGGRGHGLKPRTPPARA